jgi:hypothetical protein
VDTLVKEQLQQMRQYWSSRSLRLKLRLLALPESPTWKLRVNGEDVYPEIELLACVAHWMQDFGHTVPEPFQKALEAAVRGQGRLIRRMSAESLATFVIALLTSVLGTLLTSNELHTAVFTQKGEEFFLVHSLVARVAYKEEKSRV